MATVVTVTDADGLAGNTDNIVVVQPRRRRLLWVPRDVWSPVVGHRINTAYRRGGPELLLAALAEQGIAVEHSVCVAREAAEAFLAGVVVTVPVEAPVRLWYPVTPRARIEDGRIPVDFDPPAETLRGERIHQWIGGRSSRVADTRLPDLVRIARQQVFVRALLREGLDFRPLLSGSEPVAVSGPGALHDLGAVRWWWRFRTADRVVGFEIDGMQVLRLLAPEPQPPEWWRRVDRRVRRIGRAVQEHLPSGRG